MELLLLLCLLLPRENTTLLQQQACVEHRMRLDLDCFRSAAGGILALGGLL
jgi:hypothetical protein